MNLNFAAIIAKMGVDAAFRIINAARPPASYLFATFLPERNKTGYQAKSGYMTVRTTMAGLSGTDSPYPPTGIVDASDFSEQIAKIANRVTLSEMDQRELQQLLMVLGQAQDASEALIRDTALNFLDKLVNQAHLDAMEYLRGMAMTSGALDWTFNKKRLQVDYGLPAGNIFANAAGANGYGGNTSTWWANYRSARSKLKGQVRAILAHPTTIDMIVSNDANKIRVIEQDNTSGTMTIQKYVGSTEQMSPDARDKVTLVAYGAEGEILDPANPGKTKTVSFLKQGKIILIGNPIPTGFQVGQGATPSGQNEIPLGYTHIGPTVEGGGRPGRWADLRVPDDAPWSLEGRGVTNGLPVIEAPEKVVILSTDVV
jgi:hypothetical protein